ncbi:hypothetical protein [Streptomyces sp. NBC_00847]|uniref:hypothetical protein n=1 Tax=Streptomyces sp. NBC_00847 TaxID=2975850 RepID=UPI00225E4B86|nr:hypothetical protein [Streptomyces sp. NBC_00847]MCX4886053.1 hypothetical protein [Streptomyces sp. NBC_00847]
MTSRTKAKAPESSGGDQEQDAAAQETVKDEAPALCGSVHTLPLLAHVTCQRPAYHTDDQPQGPDQGKHRARVAGALYIW